MKKNETCHILLGEVEVAASAATAEDAVARLRDTVCRRGNEKERGNSRPQGLYDHFALAHTRALAHSNFS